MNKNPGNKQNALRKAAVVAPGLLPLPPILGGSVETVIHKTAISTATRYRVDLYGPGHAAMPPQQTRGNLNYYRFPGDKHARYFQLVRSELNKHKYDIIQVENRPLFIPGAKAANPKSRFICSLHSMVHTADNLISPSLTAKIFAQCSKVLVYSKFMRDYFVAKFPAVANRFHFIHLGADPGLFRPRWEPAVKKQIALIKAKHGIPKDFKVVLFAGRVIPKKGVHILIPAMQKVLAQYPKCCLVVVGSGWFGSRRTSPYIMQLRRLSADMAGKIKFTNYVGQHEIAHYMALADVFVCPSQWDEPFGLVNVEAMACGVPVVAAARGGIPEIVKNGLNGYLVRDEADPAAYVEPLLKLLRDDKLSEALGRGGRKDVEDYFNWSRAGRQLLELYDSILAK